MHHLLLACAPSTTLDGYVGQEGAVGHPGGCKAGLSTIRLRPFCCMVQLHLQALRLRASLLIQRTQNL